MHLIINPSSSLIIMLTSRSLVVLCLSSCSCRDVVDDQLWTRSSPDGWSQNWNSWFWRRPDCSILSGVQLFISFVFFWFFLNLGLNFPGTFSLLLWFVEDLAAKYSQSKLSQLSVILLFSASFSIYRNGESQTKQSCNLKNFGCGRKFENMYHRRTDFHNHDIFGWLGYQTLNLNVFWLSSPLPQLALVV